MRNWYENVYTQVLEAGVTALSDANYPASASYIDVSEFERFVFLIALDTVATPDFAVLQDTSATQTASVKAITGAAKTDIVTADDGKHFTIEVETARLDIANGFRYVTLQVSNTSSDNAAIVFFGCRPRRAPVTQPAAYYASVQVAG